MKHKRDVINAVWDLHSAGHSRRPVAAQTDVNQFIANLFCPGPNYHFIFDFADRSMNGVSSGTREVLGLAPERLSTQYVINELIHPDDLAHVVNCETAIAQHSMKAIPPEKITSYKYAYYFRIRHASGHYVSALHQAIPVSTDQFGRVSKVLCVMTDISFWEGPQNRHLSIIGLNGEPSTIGIVVDTPTAVDYGGGPVDFSGRELEIIRLFADGYTAREIAGLLHLSEGTVRKHRQNVLARSNSRNMTALVAHCIRRGLV